MSELSSLFICPSLGAPPVAVEIWRGFISRSTVLDCCFPIHTATAQRIRYPDKRLFPVDAHGVFHILFLLLQLVPGSFILKAFKGVKSLSLFHTIVSIHFLVGFCFTLCM